ncbi:MAG: hypothetical protein IJN08_04365, partial [Clostridia bacterium]|nr:hypothetical protein [Clostridia bacterium]
MLAHAAEHIRKAGSADFLSQLRLLPGGKSCKEPIPCGMVPLSPYMPPKAERKPQPCKDNLLRNNISPFAFLSLFASFSAFFS